MTENIVVVPDLAAVDLTALVKRELDLPYFDPSYEHWDYYTDARGQPIPGRGLKFEVFIWKPEIKLLIPSIKYQGLPPSTVEWVRRYFAARGYFGHTGAFIQWRRTLTPRGDHATIPEEDACWRDQSGLHVPCSFFLGITQHRVDGWFRGSWSFVGFKLIG